MKIDKTATTRIEANLKPFHIRTDNICFQAESGGGMVASKELIFELWKDEKHFQIWETAITEAIDAGYNVFTASGFLILIRPVLPTDDRTDKKPYKPLFHNEINRHRTEVTSRVISPFTSQLVRS